MFVPLMKEATKQKGFNCKQLHTVFETVAVQHEDPEFDLARTKYILSHSFKS